MALAKVQPNLHASLKDSFNIHARELSVVWGEDERYWTWIYSVDLTCGDRCEMGKLLNVCWLDVSKKFRAENLTAGSRYQVSFELMMEAGESGFKDHPVNFKVVIPNGNPIERRVDLSKLPKNRWSMVEVGEFKVPEGGMSGNLEISMIEHGSQWKNGLIVNKIKIISVPPN